MKILPQIKPRQTFVISDFINLCSEDTILYLYQYQRQFITKNDLTNMLVNDYWKIINENAGMRSIDPDKTIQDIKNIKYIIGDNLLLIY